MAVDGAFKTPNLLNIGLTPPYFHNGGQATLEQVVEFYNRGGDRRGQNQNDTTGTGPLGNQNPLNPNPRGSNLDPDITELGLSPQQQSDLVAFLLSLTDDRVACEKAPFDHPSLDVFNGNRDEDLDGNGRADDQVVTFPAVGANGLMAEGLACLPNTGNLFDMQASLQP